MLKRSRLKYRICVNISNCVIFNHLTYGVWVAIKFGQEREITFYPIDNVLKIDALDNHLVHDEKKFVITSFEGECSEKLIENEDKHSLNK